MQKQVKRKIRYTKAAKSPIIKKGNVVLASEALVKKGRRNLQAKMHINRGDEVVVISGDDVGKIGKVIEVFKDQSKIIVEGVNIIKRHRKSNAPGQEGEIVEIEAPIFSCKVMLWDGENKKASRLAHKELESGAKVRIYKTSGEQID